MSTYDCPALHQIYLAFMLVRAHKQGGNYDAIFADAISISIPILKLSGVKVGSEHVLVRAGMQPHCTSPAMRVGRFFSIATFLTASSVSIGGHS